MVLKLKKKKKNLFLLFYNKRQSDKKTNPIVVISSFSAMLPLIHLPTFSVDRFGELVPKEENSGICELIKSMHLVNFIVPSLFITRLKPLMEEITTSNFIINVTCREGNFSLPNKGIHHFHSNTAKASLNMLTRTISDDYVKSQIHVNSVDPGYVSCAFDTNRDCPIDIEEAALRILHPIFHVYPPPYDKLWKNYQPIAW